MEERQRIQPATIVGFGKYCGRACEWVYNQDQAVLRTDQQARVIGQSSSWSFQEFVRWEKRRELRMRERERERERESVCGVCVSVSVSVSVSVRE